VSRVVLVGLALFLASACGSDGPLADVELPGVNLPEDGSGGEPAPEPENPIETPGEGSLSSEDILILALLGGGAVVAILAITSVASSRSEKKEAERQVRRRQFADLVGGVRWVKDQGTLEILRTTDPAMLSRTWQATNARIVDLEGRAASLQLQSSDEETAAALDELGRAAGALRAALNADVSLRSDPAMADRDDLVVSSAQVVQMRRVDLDTALSPLGPRSRS
jgi:hypothetical protein